MFSIDTMSRIPLYEQLINEVETYVLHGILKPGDALPSVRKLSLDLAINPNTIQRAYAELGARKIVLSVPGRGNFIAPDAQNLLQQKNIARLQEFKNLARVLLDAGMHPWELNNALQDILEGEVDQDALNDTTVLNVLNVTTNPEASGNAAENPDASHPADAQKLSDTQQQADARAGARKNPDAPATTLQQAGAPAASQQQEDAPATTLQQAGAPADAQQQATPDIDTATEHQRRDDAQ